VRGLEKEISHYDLHIELFLDFAAQRCSVRLAIRNLAAREFPETREVNAMLPTCDEKPIRLLDDGSDDENARHFAGL